MATTAQIKRRFFALGFGFALIPAIIGVILSPSNTVAFKPRSAEISWTEALKLREHYKQSKRHFKANVEEDGSGSKVELDTLSGLRFDAVQFDTLLDPSLNGSGEKPKFIMMYFGRNPKDIKREGWFRKAHPSYTVITVGVRGSDSSLITSKVYDKANPCPPNCPKGDVLEPPPSGH